MILGFAEAPDALSTDVLVIGAGAAGLTLAHALGAAGVDVLVVESGGLTIDDRMQALNAAEHVGLPHVGVAHGRVRAFGGTTKVWPGQCLRLRPADLAEWPLEPDDLAAYYDRAEAILGTGPSRRPNETWRAARLAPLPEPGHGLEYVTSTYARPRDLGTRLREELDTAPSVRVLLGATAVRLAGAEDGARIDHVIVGDLSGRRAAIQLRRVILAAGGIENPRLLLASGIAETTAGRWFHDHPAVTAGSVHAADPQALADWFGTFFHREAQTHVKVALTEDEQRTHALAACSGSFVVRTGDDHPANALLRLRRRALRRAPPHGALRDAALVARAPRTLLSTPQRRARGLGPAVGAASIDLLCIVEQGRQPESRLSLSTESDPLGVPRARLDWQVGDAVAASAAALAERVGAWLGATGLGVVEPADELAGADWRELISDTFHHMGGTRMGRTPGDGVVDGDCRVHGVANLFVAGSSVFPSAGYANPTLTIVALAFRLADLLAAER